MARPTHTKSGTFRQDPHAEREVDPPGAGSGRLVPRLSVLAQLAIPFQCLKPEWCEP